MTDREKKIAELRNRLEIANNLCENQIEIKPNINNDLRFLLSELDRLKRGGWVSVKERLPAVGETVLIYYRHHDQQSIITARFVNGGFIGFWDADVTHWMPLPEPPEEG